MALLVCNKKYRPPWCLRENELLFHCQPVIVGNFLRFARARAHLRSVMTQKLCAVGMRNAILRNHLNRPVSRELRLIATCIIAFLFL